MAGHTRYLAAKELGIAKIPCIKATDLTEEQVKAFRLVDNKTAEFASWDYDMLSTELESIDMDMTDFGFFEADDVDISDFFVESNTGAMETEQEPAKKTVVCPKCGEEIEI